MSSQTPRRTTDTCSPHARHLHEALANEGFGVWCAVRSLNQGRFVWSKVATGALYALNRAVRSMPSCSSFCSRESADERAVVAMIQAQSGKLQERDSWVYPE